jgi:hypothetical protein
MMVTSVFCHFSSHLLAMNDSLLHHTFPETCDQVSVSNQGPGIAW